MITMTTMKMNDSQFNNLVNTNTAPSDDEIDTIRRLIIEFEPVVASLDRQITETVAIFENLIQQRKEQQRQLDKLKAIISGVRRLPAELLARIFALGLPGCHEASGCYRTKYLLHLGHVCSFWRFVSHTTPSLWAVLHLHFSQWPNLEPSGVQNDLIPFLKEWTIWTRQLPLDITLMCRTQTSHPQPGSVNILSHFLLSRSDRFQKLKLMLPLHEYYSLREIFAEMPLLEVLHLETSHSAIDTWRGPPLNLNNSPRLRSLTLRSAILISRDKIIAPWSQITELNLQGLCTVAETLGILGLTPNLQICTVKAYHDNTTPTALPGCTLTHLHTFQLNAYLINGLGVVPALVSYLKLPALRHLFLIVDDLDIASIQSIVHLRYLSEFSLESLFISVEGVAIEIFLPLFRCSPSLRVLHIQCHETQLESICVALTYQASDTQIITPWLETLTLDVNIESGIGFGAQALIDMIKSRWWEDFDQVHPEIARLNTVLLSDLCIRTLCTSELRQLTELERSGVLRKL